MSDRALEEFRQAIREKPDNSSALRLVIEVLIKKGDTQSLTEAQVDLKQGQAFWPGDPRFVSTSDLLGDLAEAIRQREETAKKSPENTGNLRRLAALYVRQKEPKRRSCAAGGVRQAPDNFVLADRLAHLYREVNQEDNALKMYDHFIASHDPETSYWAKLLFGDMYKSFGT